MKDLERIHAHPIKRKSGPSPNWDSAAIFYKKIYASEDRHDYTIDDGHGKFYIPPFTVEELNESLKKMSKGKCLDRNGLALEMFLFGGEKLHQRLIDIYNEMLMKKEFPQGWLDIIFVLLPKSGNLDDPNNWRPIAILDITYKNLARLLYGRLKKKCELQQSDEQFGFRGGHSTSDALIILESMISKSFEWNFPLWVVSIDMRKAFDRVEHKALFAAMRK